MRALVITPLAIGTLVGVFMIFACGTYITLIPNGALSGKFMRVFTHQTATVVPVMLWYFLVSEASDRPKEWARAVKGFNIKGMIKEILDVWKSR